MICKSCMEGGKANRDGDIDKAMNFHSQCEFKDCCCQHKTTAHTESGIHFSS